MMKHEFEALAGYMVTDGDYSNVIEPMYMATNLSKVDFIAALNRKRFEYVPVKSPERIRLEKSLNQEMSELKNEITYYTERINTLNSFLSFEDDQYWVNYYKQEIKRYKAEIKLYKQRISGIKFVLS